MSQQAAKRRRKQAVNGYRHMSVQRRPHYSKSDDASAMRRAEAEKRRRAALMQRGYKGH